MTVIVSTHRLFRLRVMYAGANRARSIAGLLSRHSHCNGLLGGWCHEIGTQDTARPVLASTQVLILRQAAASDASLVYLPASACTPVRAQWAVTIAVHVSWLR